MRMPASIRRGLILVLAAVGLSMAAAAADPAPQILDQPLPAGSTRSSVAFNVAAIGEARLGLQFELPQRVTRARLVDPAGRETLLLPGRDLQVIDAAQRRQAPRGHLHLLRQPWLDPMAGVWRLALDHAAAHRGDTLHLVVSLLPRFGLNLGVVGGPAQRLGAGSEYLLELRGSDHGLPDRGPTPQARWQHADSGRHQALDFWHERPAGYDLPVQAEAGQRFAVFAPDAPGRYTVDVQQAFVGRDGRPQVLQRRLELDVAGQPVLGQLVLTQPMTAGGCVPRVRFAVDWLARQPGRLALTVVLQGDGRALQVRGGVDVGQPGPVQVQAEVAARDLLALGEGLRVRRVDLLWLSDQGFELLQRRRDLPTSEPLATDRLCR
jgi:hypothetical protein